MPKPIQTDRVLIKDLVIKMSAGIYAHEKAEKQNVIFNISLAVESNATRALSTINDVVSYEDIVNEVRECAHSKHYDLLEELAEDISFLCLQKDQVLSATIRIEKPDIIQGTKSVGIEIIRFG